MINEGSKFLLAVLLIASVGISGCIKNEELLSVTEKFTKIEKGRFNDLEITLELQRAAFHRGEIINTLITLENKGANPVQLDEQGFDLGVYSSDGTFITYISRENYMPKPVTLGPGVSLIESLDWRNALEPGTYYLVGYLKAETTFKGSNNKIEPYTVRTGNLSIKID